MSLPRVSFRPGRARRLGRLCGIANGLGQHLAQLSLSLRRFPRRFRLDRIVGHKKHMGTATRELNPGCLFLPLTMQVDAADGGEPAGPTRNGAVPAPLLARYAWAGAQTGPVGDTARLLAGGNRGLNKKRPTRCFDLPQLQALRSSTCQPLKRETALLPALFLVLLH
jgi:hypothetical protein